MSVPAKFCAGCGVETTSSTPHADSCPSLAFGRVPAPDLRAQLTDTQRIAKLERRGDEMEEELDRVTGDLSSGVREVEDLHRASQPTGGAIATAAHVAAELAALRDGLAELRLLIKDVKKHSMKGQLMLAKANDELDSRLVVLEAAKERMEDPNAEVQAVMDTTRAPSIEQIATEPPGRRQR